jgi:hypothetical protein
MPLIVESHRVISGQSNVRLSRYGWFVVVLFAVVIAVWSAVLAIGLPGLFR